MTQSNQPRRSELLAAVEKHYLDHRASCPGRIHASALGGNGGLASTASLLIGSVAAGLDSLVIAAGIAGITEGAMSKAVGVYVSVSSQNDIETADKTLEIEHQRIVFGGMIGMAITAGVGQLAHSSGI